MEPIVLSLIFNRFESSRREFRAIHFFSSKTILSLGVIPSEVLGKHHLGNRKTRCTNINTVHKTKSNQSFMKGDRE
jgi:hypothetical protein